MGVNFSNEIFKHFFSGKGGAATVPDGNDVAKEDEVADGVSKHVTSS